MPAFECPTCGKLLSVERKEDARFRPFCSRRCKLVDLGRWFDGTYSINEPMVHDDLTGSRFDGRGGGNQGAE